jgi:hypothetical protein
MPLSASSYFGEVHGQIGIPGNPVESHEYCLEGESGLLGPDLRRNPTRSPERCFEDKRCKRLASFGSPVRTSAYRMGKTELKA